MEFLSALIQFLLKTLDFFFSANETSVFKINIMQ